MTEVHRDIPREPSLQDTAMVIKSPEDIERLQLKLEEYRQRAAARREHADDLGPDMELRQWADELFKEPILDYVVSAALARDQTDEGTAVTILEVGGAVGESTGYDLSLSMITPFRFVEERGVFQPDIPRLLDEGTLADVAFSTAYGIVKEYVNGEV